MNALDAAESLEGGNVLDARFPADLIITPNLYDIRGKLKSIGLINDGLNDISKFQHLLNV